MGTSASDDTVEYEPPQEERPAPATSSDSASVAVDAAGLSHPGKLRPNNEDHFLISRFSRSLEVLQTNLAEIGLPPRTDEIGYALAVADGLGGAAAGEVASGMAIRALVRLTLEVPDWILRLDRQPLADEVKRRVAERYGQINAELGDEALRDPSLSGFGTTLTLAASLGKDLFVAHVGDSRAYLFCRQRLQRLTRDDTLVQAQVDLGLLAEEEVARHRMRHVLIKVIGDHARGAEPDVRHHSLEDGDWLLLCTDGLTDMVPDRQIETVLGSDLPAAAVCDRLIEAALAAGGKDNVTVIAARYRFPSPAPEGGRGTDQGPPG